jgi:hypothetical protein
VLSAVEISVPFFIAEFRGFEVSPDLDEEVIRFGYKLWMFKVLKARHPELSDEDIIKFIEIGGFQ